jgi:hypothetical protein
MKRTTTIWIGFTLLALALTACGPGASDPPSGLPDDVETAVKETLSAREEIPIEEIEVVEAEEKEWSDACLGLAGEDEVCAQVITPGWKVTLRANGEMYVLHTNEDGTAVRME